jgi:hypothetical protein
VDPERSAEESTARARRNLRRYCTSLGVDRLATLTFRCRRCQIPTGCECVEGPDRPKHDELDYVLHLIDLFRRAVMADYGPTPLVVVVEHHDDGHLHVHVGFGRFFDKHRFRALWPHGFVDLRRLKSKGIGPGGRRQARVEARKVASYLAKYVTKERHDRHRKSYSTTRGLVPGPRRARFMREVEAERWLADTTGEMPSHTWSSATMEDWSAPPVRLLFYDGLP